MTSLVVAALLATASAASARIGDVSSAVAIGPAVGAGVTLDGDGAGGVITAGLAFATRGATPLAGGGEGVFDLDGERAYVHGWFAASIGPLLVGGGSTVGATTDDGSLGWALGPELLWYPRLDTRAWRPSLELSLRAEFGLVGRDSFADRAILQVRILLDIW